MSLKKVLFFIVLTCSMSLTVLGQPVPDDDIPDPENPVPITGIEYLLAAGAALGLKKIYDKKKKST